MNKRLGFSLLLVTVFFVSGCGGVSRTTVKGKVTVAGKGPLTGGNITFVLASNEKIYGGGIINADGTYEVVTAPIGECIVLIDNSHLNTAGKTSAIPTVPVGPSIPGVPGKPGSSPGVSKAPKDTESKMGSSPSGIDAPGGTNPGKQTYMKIDELFSKLGSSPLKSTVTNGKATPSDFEVK
ncbi:MAG: hypothetical protein SNJ82_12205 [Gemmataceae bacterium]